MHPKRNPCRFTRLITHTTLAAFLVASIPAPAHAAPARRTVRNVAEAPAAQQTSSTALCDETSDQNAGGYGGMVLGWPESHLGENLTPDQKRENDAYNKKAEEYMRERRETVLNKNTETHRKYLAPANAQQPNLKPSMDAATAYFELSFGRQAVTITICDIKRKLAKQFAAYDAAKQQSASVTGEAANACEGAFKQMFDSYKAAEQSYRHLVEVINKRLNGYEGRDRANRPVKIEGLRPAYFRYFRIHNTTNNSQTRLLETVNKPDVEKVKDEFARLWGRGTETQPDSNGPFSSVLLQTQQEGKKAEEKQAWFRDNQAKHEELRQRCERVPGGPAIPGEDALGRPPRQDERPPPRDDRPPPRDDTPPPRDDRPPPRDDTPPPRDDTPPPRDQKPQKGGMSGFLKDNWAWLAIGGAAVGGGAYLYKRHQDKKRDKETDALLANYANRPTHGYTPYVGGGSNVTGGTPGSGTVPAGSRLMIKSAIGNVRQGDTVPAIEVFLVDQNGVPVKANNVAIEASCYVPQPCSLTGGKSVTTIDGAATFNSLVFNQAHTGVRMQFSAPGVPTVTTPNAFDVTPTDVRRMETRDQVN